MLARTHSPIQFPSTIKPLITVLVALPMKRTSAFHRTIVFRTNDELVQLLITLPWMRSNTFSKISKDPTGAYAQPGRLSFAVPSGAPTVHLEIRILSLPLVILMILPFLLNQPT